MFNQRLGSSWKLFKGALLVVADLIVKYKHQAHTTHMMNKPTSSPSLSLSSSSSSSSLSSWSSPSWSSSLSSSSSRDIHWDKNSFLSPVESTVTSLSYSFLLSFLSSFIHLFIHPFIVWGRCSSSIKFHFNWELAMADLYLSRTRILWFFNQHIRYSQISFYGTQSSDI